MEATGSNVRRGQHVAVVMGAGGMALAVARRLGDTHRVLLADRDAAVLEREVAALRSAGLDAFGEVCDVTDADAVQRVAERAVTLGEVRSLAHVVGVSPSLGDAATILRVNLRGPALVARAFEPVMRAGGAALFVSSLAAHLGDVPPEVMAAMADATANDLVSRVQAVAPDFSPTDAYRFSKTALNLLVLRLAAPWGGRGLRIVSLSPGLIATPMGAREFGSPQKQALYELSPAQREGTMIEIADAADFLLSDRASFISGTDLLVDGGLAAAVRHASGL